MSTIDILSSFGWFLSTWAVPEGSFALSRGSRGSCSFQGFLLQLAVGAPLYNSSLALFYLLMIRFRWTDEMLQGIERWVHAFILFFSIGTSFLLLPLDQYNHIGAVCWVIGDPAECGNSSYKASGIPCERGEHAWIYGVTLFYGPLWVCVVCCVVSMGVIYRQVKWTLRQMDRYAVSGDSRHGRRNDADGSRVATQAILYSLSFLITWMPSTLWSVAHWFNWKTFWLDLCAGIFEPSQGLLNLFIFARKRQGTHRKIKRFLSTVLPCCFTYTPFIRSFGISTKWNSRIVSELGEEEPIENNGSEIPENNGDDPEAKRHETQEAAVEEFRTFPNLEEANRCRSNGSGSHHDMESGTGGARADTIDSRRESEPQHSSSSENGHVEDCNGSIHRANDSSSREGALTKTSTDQNISQAEGRDSDCNGNNRVESLRRDSANEPAINRRFL